jgi:hypothetical protein
MKARVWLLAAVRARAAAAPGAPAPGAFTDCSPGGVPARCGSIPRTPSSRRAARSGSPSSSCPRSSSLPGRTPSHLAGGPGGAATDAVPAALTFWRDTHLRHDMLFVDQRGTGG